MPNCRRCLAAMPDESAEESFAEIERLLRAQKVKREMIKKLARNRGPLCAQCVPLWAREFIWK
jgi:hypothetical protein